MRVRALAVLLAAGLSVSSSPVRADESLGNAALGAISGAVVLGPIGAVAGAAVGYTAGKSIARGMGFKQSPKSRRKSARPAKAVRTRHAAAPASAPVPPSRPHPQAEANANAFPPTQAFE